jgi:ubiquinone/menaquinone biosynthesis C-methylase UbiE
MPMEGITPESYRRWRESRLGSTTERLEMELVFELAGPLSGRRLLDVGCGDGAYLIEAARKGAAVVGVDASEPMLQAARQRGQALRADIEVRRGEAQALPFPEGAFDVVFAVTLLCLQSDPAAVLSELARVLAPGGRLVVGELGRWSL